MIANPFGDGLQVKAPLCDPEHESNNVLGGSGKRHSILVKEGIHALERGALVAVGEGMVLAEAA